MPKTLVETLAQEGGSLREFLPQIELDPPDSRRVTACLTGHSDETTS